MNEKNKNIDRFREDLDSLISQGELLVLAFQYQVAREETEKLYEKALGKEEFAKIKKTLPSFTNDYQSWYSEAIELIGALLPRRIEDFKKLYEKPKTRKEITYENYVIEDALQGLKVTRGIYEEKVVGQDAALPRLQQQQQILRAVNRRFESSLFDIKSILQADLFDTELEAARELAKKGFLRGAGAIAGVVLEGHLGQVCENHGIIIRKKKPSISDYNDALKNGDVIDTPRWRFNQHLGDIRNLCDHKGDQDPSKDQVTELIDGVEKVTKTIF